MKRVHSALGAVTLALAIAASVYGADTVRPDPTATARLDRDHGQIILPIDEYLSDDATETTMTRARLAIMRSCLQSKGHKGTKPPQSDDHTELEDRCYGLWLPERARTHGFDVPGPKPVAAETPTGSGSAVPIMLQAWAKARQSPEWAAARDDWSHCLTDPGLTPVGEDDGWTSREALALPAPALPRAAPTRPNARRSASP